jgi:flagellar L-ring protein precursor FlgH
MYNRHDGKKMGLILGISILVMFLPLAGTGGAVSLWSDTSHGASLSVDQRAHVVGDIITIVISETSTATRTGTANNSKTSSMAVNAGAGIFTGIMPGSGGSSDAFTTKGAISNSNVVTGEITVVVTGVKPNGNLLISGTQDIKQNGEDQKISVTGEIRPEDVSTDNKIMSYLVANAQIHVEGKGPLAGKQQQGILTQLFNFLF